MKEYVIYTKSLAYKLRECGFNLIRTGINKNFPQYNTFIFEDSEQLQKAITKLTKKN